MELLLGDTKWSARADLQGPEIYPQIQNSFGFTANPGQGQPHIAAYLLHWQWQPRIAAYLLVTGRGCSSLPFVLNWWAQFDQTSPRQVRNERVVKLLLQLELRDEQVSQRTTPCRLDALPSRPVCICIHPSYPRDTGSRDPAFGAAAVQSP